MTKAYFLPIILLLLCFAGKSHSVEVTDLYVGKVQVASQSQSDRNTGLKDAMAQVMLKVAGNPEFNQQADIRAALRRPSSYVAQFYYDRVEEQTLLVAEFDPEKINQLFYQANLPILGSIRPLLTLWLVEEDNLARNIINHSSDNTLAQSVKDFAQQRAMPIVLPLMDLEDIGRVQVSDIWGRFEEPVQLASQRYLSEATVVIRVSNNTLVDSFTQDETCELPCQSEVYALDWSLIESYQQFGERIQGTNKQQLLETALVAITQKVNERYALSSESKQQYTIEVANVESLTTYVEITRFLADFSAVTGVKLSYAQGSVRRFELTLLGTEAAFLASLKLVDQLKQEIDPLAGVDEQAIPVFYWQN